MRTVADGVARISWDFAVHRDGLWDAVDVVRREVEAALAGHGRVEALIRADDETGQRVATWAGMRREGVMRGIDGDRIVYARLETDVPVSEPEGFRALLNSFLPRKRAISQMLIRDPDDRVLLCRLTYKQDWDLPGRRRRGGRVTAAGGEPRGLGGARPRHQGRPPRADRLAAALGWLGRRDLPGLRRRRRTRPRSIEDIVRQEREIRAAEFCTLDQVRERAADFTARRVEAAVANLGSGTPTYTESGR